MKKRNLYLVSGSILLLLIFAFLWLHKKYEAIRDERDILLLSIETKDSKLSSVKNKLLTEKQAAKKLLKDNSDLLEEILILKKRKESVKYIIETKYKTKTVEKVLTVLPENYLFSTSYGMPICEYKKNTDLSSYVFKTLPVEYSVNIINTDQSTSVKVIAKSEYNNKTYEIPLKDIKTESIKIKEEKDKIFRTDLSVGVVLNTDLTFGSTIGASFIHYKNFDFIKTNIIVNESVSLGVSPVSYNLKDKVSILQDLSIELGAFKGFQKEGLYIGLSTKF
jgi:hypothetical protein